MIINSLNRFLKALKSSDPYQDQETLMIMQSQKSTYKTFKTEFCRKRFETLEQLETELFDYVIWYNTRRIHGSLGYLSPVEYRKTLSI